MDDQSDVVALCSSQLTRYGFSVFSTRHGKEAVSKFIEERPEIIVVKYELPDENGVKVAELILAIRRSAKVIMFSSDTEALLAAEGMGAEVLLPTPLPLEKLLAAILALF